MKKKNSKQLSYDSWGSCRMSKTCSRPTLNGPPIELREKTILLISPVSTCDFKGKSMLGIFQKKFIQIFTPPYQNLKSENSCKYIYTNAYICTIISVTVCWISNKKLFQNSAKNSYRLRRKLQIKILLLQPFDVTKYLTISLGNIIYIWKQNLLLNHQIKWW